MDRLTRVISIMIDLINHKVVSTNYLSNKYEVSTRTIYRDIEVLDLSGIPIITKRGKMGGFAVLEGFKIDKSLLSEKEFSIILRGLQALINNGDKEAQAIYEKLISILENTKKEQIIKHSNNIVIDISPYEMQKEIQKNDKEIQKAIEEKKCIEIEYRSVEKGYSKRVIEPLALLFKTANWYVYAYCRKRKENRYFKLARIEQIKILEETITEREIEISQYEPFFSSKEETEIILKTNDIFSKFIQENYAVTKVEEKEDGIYVTIQYPLNDWVYQMILSFGDKVTVIYPESVKKKIKEIIEKMSKIYKEG